MQLCHQGQPRWRQSPWWSFHHPRFWSSKECLAEKGTTVGCGRCPKGASSLDGRHYALLWLSSAHDEPLRTHSDERVSLCARCVKAVQASGIRCRTEAVTMGRQGWHVWQPAAHAMIYARAGRPATSSNALQRLLETEAEREQTADEVCAAGESTSALATERKDTKLKSVERIVDLSRSLS